MGGCSAVAAPIVGGRRRRSSKKTRGRRKMRGGNFYGFTGALNGTTAGAGWAAVENVGVDGSGNPVPDAVMPKVGGRRRRTSKKSRKSRHRRRRTMRGGAAMYNSANVGYGFAGSGVAGLPNQSAYAANAPAGGTQVNGVWQA